MNIGIVTTWFERGAAYVSRTYMDLMVQLGHRVFIYARGGDGKPDKNSKKWNENYVTRDNKYNDTQVRKSKFFHWIKKNHLDMVLFNEQRHFKIVAQCKKRFPCLKVGAYIDYYKEDTIPLYNMYDFIICNTERHLQAMAKHPQAFYLKWGVDTDLYKRKESIDYKKIVFFHSAGMSIRKGTDVLINAFIHGNLYEKSKLIIHTQKPIEKICNYKREELEKYGIDIIEKTVGAPGLYEMGNVYVYPTRLDGLGLTLYEAMSFGMPIIATDYPPMNEAISEENGSLIKVKDHYCRADAYYYPMSICDENDLIEKMQGYIDNPKIILQKGDKARQIAVESYSLESMRDGLNDILNKIQIRSVDLHLYKKIIKLYCSPVLKGLKEISENNNFLRWLKSKI